MFTVQTAPGPQGEGSQGSGFSTHLWLWQTKPLWQSGSTTHSGLHPEMVSGLGMRPGWHLQMAFPVLVTEQSAPGPHGDGTQGSGFSIHFWFWQTNPLWQSGSMTHSGLHPEMVSGFGIRPGWHLQIALPVLVTEHSAPGPHGFGSHGSGFTTHLWLWQMYP